MSAGAERNDTPVDRSIVSMAVVKLNTLGRGKLCVVGAVFGSWIVRGVAPDEIIVNDFEYQYLVQSFLMTYCIK